MTTRRDFLKTATASALAARLGSLHGVSPWPEPAGRPNTAPLDILVLGGTGFIGPHLVRHAVARGHRLTTFTRGQHVAELPAEVTRLTGDRNGQLDSLRGKRWDAVIDDSANTVEPVVLSTELLKDA